MNPDLLQMHDAYLREEYARLGKRRTYSCGPYRRPARDELIELMREQLAEREIRAEQEQRVKQQAGRLQREADRFLWACIQLAADVEACEALLRGEAVPIHRLRPEVLRRLEAE
jgi:hypothetical protein